MSNSGAKKPAVAATARISRTQIGEMRAIQDRIESSSLASGGIDLADVGPLNREFHQIFAQASQQRRLVATLRNSIEATIVQHTYRRYSRAQLLRSFMHHRELIEAFESRDPDWARATMTCHVRAACNALLGATQQETAADDSRTRKRKQRVICRGTIYRAPAKKPKLRITLANRGAPSNR